MTRRSVLRVSAFAVVWLVGQVALAGTLSVTAKYAEGTTAEQKALFESAIKSWTKCLMGPKGNDVTLTINVTFKDLGTDTGGGTFNLMADANDNPKSADMEINTNAVLFFGAGAVPADKFDALSIMRHEIGHALGFAGGTVASGLGYKKWNECITEEKGVAIFDKGGLNVTLSGTDANGRSHLDQAKYPDDLMIPVPVKKGQRKDPSMLDYKMLGKAFGYQVCPEPSSYAMAGMGGLGVLGLAWRHRRRALAA